MADGALIMAAAAGTGFGGAVALGSWPGGTVLDHVVAIARAAGLDDVVVVLGPCDEAVLASSRLDGATVVLDDEWAEGMASGLRAGLDTMWRYPELDTAVILDVAHPGVDAGTISHLVGVHHEGSRPVTLPKYRYSRGGPVLVDRELWPRLMGLEGAVDLVELLEAHPQWATEVWIDHVPPARVETPDDLEAVVAAR